MNQPPVPNKVTENHPKTVLKRTFGLFHKTCFNNPIILLFGKHFSILLLCRPLLGKHAELQNCSSPATNKKERKPRLPQLQGTQQQQQQHRKSQCDRYNTRMLYTMYTTQ